MAVTDYEPKAEELAQWLDLPMTGEFRRRLLEAFEAHNRLLAQETGSTADLLKGNAEVLEFVRKPHLLFED